MAVAALVSAILLILAATQSQAQPLTALTAVTCGSDGANPSVSDLFKHFPRAPQT